MCYRWVRSRRRVPLTNEEYFSDSIARGPSELINRFHIGIVPTELIAMPHTDQVRGHDRLEAIQAFDRADYLQRKGHASNQDGRHQ